MSERAAAVESKFIDLIWQFRLQAERQLQVRESFRTLVAEPARLEQLLTLAEGGGDVHLKRLAGEIRALRGAPSVPAQPSAGLGNSAWKILAGAIGAAVIVIVAYVLAVQPRAAPVIAQVAPASQAPVAYRTLFRIHGSNTIGEKLAPALLDGWLRSKGARTTDVKVLGKPEERRVSGALDGARESPAVEVFAHGSSTAFKDLAEGLADLGMSSRRAKPEEISALASRGDLTAAGAENVVGLDGLAVVVHPANTVTQLSIDQVARIFAGEVTDWSQVGGAAGAIQVLARDDQSGTYDTFKSLVLEAGEKRKLAQSAQRFESSGELSDAVAGAQGAIGFIGLPYVRQARALAISATQDGRAVMPTAFTVGTEDYPLSRRLYLYQPGVDRNKDAAAFVEYALSEPGQEIVKEVGFVSQNLYTESPADDASLPEEYRQFVAGAQRLSLNFRFVAGGNALDTKGQRDLKRVVDYLARNPGRAPILVGFADNTGADDANVALSRSRARSIETAFQARGIYARDVRGFGSAAPIASNDTQAGREKNRRVEVWFR